MGIGERLSVLRKEKKLTLRELSEKVGITAAALSSYEKGQKEPSLSFAIKLADFYGVSLDDLCDRKPVTNERYSFLYSITCFILMVFNTFFAPIRERNKITYSKFEDLSAKILGTLDVKDNRTLFILEIRRKDISEFFETYAKLDALCDSEQIPTSVVDDWLTKSFERLRNTELHIESSGEES
ncbi:MAG: helix-turn-helix domain-containing protein [Candidatus Ventricola sp.]|nr:helix-turn-helix domain-containing protein [Candidatus Ventricola sp.]